MDTVRSDGEAGLDSARSHGSNASVNMNNGTEGGPPVIDLPSIPASLTLHVSVREAVITVECGHGNQTFAWLAQTACHSYTNLHPHLAGSQALSPIHLCDSAGKPLYPYERLGDCVDNGDTLQLELLGPQIGVSSESHSRRRSLWELYLHQPQRTQSVPFIFLFDAKQVGIPLESPPAIIGNFNAWRKPIQMQYWKGDTYRFQTHFPAGAEVVFKFLVDGRTILTPHQYPLVYDSRGTKLHHIMVEPLPPLPSLDASYDGPQCLGLSANSTFGEEPGSLPVRRELLTMKEIIAVNNDALARAERRKALESNGSEIPVIPARIVAGFDETQLQPNTSNTQPDEKEATEQESQRRIAAREWNQIAPNIADVLTATIQRPDKNDATNGQLRTGTAAGGPTMTSSTQKVSYKPTAQKLVELRQVFARYHRELHALFDRFALEYPGGWSSVGPHWNLFLLQQFLYTARISPDGVRCHITRIAKIVEQVVGRKDPAHKVGMRGGAAAGAGMVSAGGKTIDAGSVPFRSAQNGTNNIAVGKITMEREDLFSSLNALSRSEWIEVLIRIAVLKFKNPTPQGVAASEGNAAAAVSAAANASALGIDGALFLDKRDDHRRAAGLGGKAPPPPPVPPPPAHDSNPALSFELLLCWHLIPYLESVDKSACASGWPTQVETSPGSNLGSFGPSSVLLASSIPGHSLDRHAILAGNIGYSGSVATNALRFHILADRNIHRMLQVYAAPLARLFRYYTGGGLGGGSVGVHDSALGISLNPTANSQPHAAQHAGIIGGASQGLNLNLLPPTLLGTTLTGGIAAQMASRVGQGGNGAAAASTSTSSLATSTISLRELDSLFLDYELLDPSIPRARALAALGLSPESEDGTGGSDGDAPIHLLYHQWIELLIRIAALGTKWSAAAAEAQRKLDEAIANGNMDKLPQQQQTPVDDADNEDGTSGAGTSRGQVPASDMDDDLHERFLRLLQWIFPTEQEQFVRRAKIAAIQQAQAAPIPQPTKKEKKAKKEEAAAAAAAAATAASQPASAKGRSKPASASRNATPAKPKKK